MTTVYICDICGENERPLYPLNVEYQTNDIKEVCQTCERKLNSQLLILRGVTNNILKFWIRRE